MTRINVDNQTAKIDNFYKGYTATHLIHIGDKLGIFEVLNNHKDGISPSDLALELGLYESYLKIWCQTALYFEILDFDEYGRFKFQPYMNEILGDKSNFRNYLGRFNLAINVTGKRFKEGLEYYRTGKIIESYSSVRSEIVAESTKPLHAFLTSYFKTLPKTNPIKKMLENGIKFLDVGCGTGRFIIQLAKIFTNSRFVGVDPISHGIEAGKKIIEQLRLTDRVLVENLGGENLQYNEEFDIVCMVATFHEINPTIRFKVMENIYKGLKNDGRLFIVDFSFPDNIEDFKNSKYEPGIIDQFNETCLGVVHLSTFEQNEMFTKVGFKDIQRMTIKGFDIIIGVK
ncbi:MAG: class I SAM-dependent methyltransferase [Candidatus Heimdallarchaeota archaeon]